MMIKMVSVIKYFAIISNWLFWGVNWEGKSSIVV